MSKESSGVLRKKVILGLNAWVSVILAFMLTVMVCYFLYRHGVRFDISATQNSALSPRTLELLSGLDSDVDVVAFFRTSSELYPRIRAILREYEFCSGRVRVVFVDPDRDIAQTAELSARFDVNEPNVVVFSSGGRTKYVTEEALADYDYAPMLSGNPRQIVAYRVEQAFSSAIYSVVQGAEPTIYFLAGHGEQRIDDYDRYKGYSSLARLLRRDNMVAKTLELGKSGSIPDDCSAIVIPGPRRTLVKHEVGIIRSYVDRGGRLLLMLNPGHDSGLDSLLKDWGVQVTRNRVLGLTLTGRELLVTSYGKHPVTEKLAGTTTIFNMPCAVEPLVKTNAPAGGSADKPRVTVLATGEWAETDLAQVPPKFDPDSDIQGPVSVAVAVERGPSADVQVEMQPTRIVVLGDSTMLCNGALAAGYSVDLFMSALDWLVEREQLLAISARTQERFVVSLSRGQSQSILGVLAGVIPGAVIVVGVGVWLRRRR